MPMTRAEAGSAASFACEETGAVGGMGEGAGSPTGPSVRSVWEVDRLGSPTGVLGHKLT